MKVLSKDTRKYLKRIIKNYKKQKKIIKNNEKIRKIWMSFYGLKRQPLSKRDYLESIFIYITPYNLYVASAKSNWSTNHVYTGIGSKSEREFYFINKKYLVRLNELANAGYIHMENQLVKIYHPQIDGRIYNPSKNDDEYLQHLENALKKYPNAKTINAFFLTEEGLKYFNIFKWFQRNANFLAFVAAVLAIIVSIVLAFCFR